MNLDVSDKIGTNWDDALNGFVSDGRIGDSHLNVPGMMRC